MNPPVSRLLMLSGAALRRLVTPADAVAALRAVYRALADHRGDQGRSLGFAVALGSIHVKAGLMPGTRAAFAAKVNVNLPGNEARTGRPTIQGVVVLADTADGRPLAVVDSITLTSLRTAATAALAATFGARADSRRLAIIGAGAQARDQLAAFAAAFRLESVAVFDLDDAKAAAFARAAGAGASYRCGAAPSIAAALDGADLVVTCTTAAKPVLTADMALNGAFVAAVGADNPAKQEIDPALMARARVLVDDLDACAAGGDLFHALAAGTMTRDAVHADLADLAAGRKTGRARADELVIFDSTGSGVQDVALAEAAYRAARGREDVAAFDLAQG
jgi:ornithine cyclodeaminase/alanine dehydrogenase-like protein (mu-crystallin family)